MTARKPLPYFLAKGAFATSSAAEFGITRGRMRASDLKTPFRGVRSAGIDLDERVQRCRAAEAFMNERDAFSHSTAIGLWGAPLPIDLDAADAELHIGTRGDTRRRRVGIIGHRLPAGTRVCSSPDGLRTVPPATAWCQLASQVGERLRGEMLVMLVAVADFLITGERRKGTRMPPICTLEDLRTAIEAHGSKRGSRLLAEAAESARVEAESPKETELRLLLIGHGLSEPELGVVISTDLGPLTPDLAYPSRRVLIEYEGDVHRTNRRRWRGDFERVRAFQQAGWTVIRVNSDDLTDDTRRSALIAQLRALLL